MLDNCGGRRATAGSLHVMVRDAAHSVAKAEARQGSSPAIAKSKWRQHW